MLESALTAGILAMGGDVIRVGVLPTPGIAFLARQYGADAGVVISASHNPFQFNGIKFFNGKGFKLDDSLEDEIEKLITEGSLVAAVPDPIGSIIGPEEIPAQQYGRYLQSTFEGSLEGIRLVLDCANGASSVLAQDVFEGLGAEVTMIGCEPDGLNINKGCGSTHPEKLAETVVEKGADLGLAFDGDRLISIFEKYMKETGTLAENRVTVTQMSNIGFHRRAKELGVEVDVTGVGDRYVLESMLKTGSVLGGEQSGHIILLNYSTTGDGMLAGLQLLKAFCSYDATLSELAAEMTVYPQVLVNAAVSNDKKELWSQDQEIVEAIERANEQVTKDGKSGRAFIRTSGTEPLVRVMIEGEDPEEIRPLAEELAALIRERLS